nr:MAG TPA: hypothetical protein [Caudoviricetes sp.]
MADFSHHPLYINNTYPLRNFPIFRSYRKNFSATYTNHLK